MEAAAIFIGLILSLIPGLVATRRDCKHQAGIWILSLLLGWTFIGWVAALVWAVSDDTEDNARLSNNLQEQRWKPKSAAELRGD